MLLSLRSSSLIIASVASAMLIQQILLTRILSVMLYYHFGFAVVSITMLGLTVGALFVFTRWRLLSAEAIAARLPRVLGIGAAVAFFSVLFLALPAWLVQGLDIPPRPESSLFIQVISLSIIATVVGWLTTFTCAGIAIAAILTRMHARVGPVYAADLCGAAAGCWLTILLLEYTEIGVIPVLLLSVLLLMIAACLAAHYYGMGKEISRYKIGVACIAGFIIAAVAVQHYAFEWLYLHNTKFEESETVEYEHWNTYSRVTVGESETKPPFGWGMNAAIKEKYPNIPYRMLRIDALAATVLTQFDGNLKKHAYLNADVTNAAYRLRTPKEVLVVGVGGGRDILAGLVNGARHVTGAEINRAIVDLHRVSYKNYSGGLAEDPRVNIVNEEARSYIATSGKSFDLIQVSLVDTWAATASGAFALSENSLYTREAWQLFYRSLSPQGMLSFSRWYVPKVYDGELLRMVSMAYSTLKEAGIERPQDHVLVIGSPPIATLIVSKMPISRRELARVKQQIQPWNFDLVLSPETAKTPLLQTLISSGKASGDETILNLSPPTDNQPFFFNMLPLSSLFQDVSAKYNHNLQSIQVLWWLLLGLSVASVILVYKPMQLLGEARKGVPYRAGLIYFSMLGAGFMFIEIALMQRLSLYLGKPAMAFAIVLFGLLLATGIGSALSEKLWPKYPRHRLLLLCIVVGALIVVLNPLIYASYTQPDAIRMLLTFACVFTTGLVLGFGFPTGMNRVHSGITNVLAPWFWGINGITSVLGSVLALFCTIYLGIIQTLTIGLGCYILAWWAFARIPENTVHTE